MENTSLSTNYVGKAKSSRNLGFTLIELSIVLVIIGQDLIYAASVRSQIKQIEEIETQINTFKLKYNCLPGDCANATDYFGTTSPQGDSVNNGDDDGIIKSTYGNNIAYGAGECLNPDVSGEVSQLFLHLYLAGIGKDYTAGTLNPYPIAPSMARIGKEYPYAKFGNATGVFVSCLTSNDPYWWQATPLFLRSGNILVIGANGNIAHGGRINYDTGFYIYGSYGSDASGTYTPIGIPADAARRIDQKIDDGLPSIVNPLY